MNALVARWNRFTLLTNDNIEFMNHVFKELHLLRNWILLQCPHKSNEDDKHVNHCVSHIRQHNSVIGFRFIPNISLLRQCNINTYFY